MAKVLFSLLFLHAFAVSVQPGAKTYLGIGAFESLKNAYIPMIKPSKIHDLNVTVGFLFSEMKFNLHDITFQNFSLTSEQVSITFDPKKSELAMVISNFYLNTTANFGMDWYGMYQGHTSVSLKNSVIKLPITIGTSNKRATVTIDKATGDLSSLLFKFHSNNKFLNFIGLAEYIWPLNHINELLIKHSLTHIGNQLNPMISNFLANITYNQVIGNANIALDYYLLNFGISSTSSFEAGIVGLFLVPSMPFDVPPTLAMNVSLNWVSTLDFRFQLTDFFFNTFLWAMSDAGYLNMTINSGSFPQYKSFLTTTGMRLFVPALESQFGENMPVSVNCGLGQFPTIKITTGKAMLNTNCVCQFSVQKSIVTFPAFTLMWNIASSVGGYLDNNAKGLFLNYQINAYDTVFSQFAITSTSVGPIEVSGIESAINFAIESVIGYINPQLGQFALKVPMPAYMNLTSTSLISYPRGIEISGEPVFTF